MPDIAQRFHKDMLVLSAPVDTVLLRQGVNVARDREFMSLIEPEALRNAYRMENVAGAQILVTNTAGITYARLSHVNMEDKSADIAQAALKIVNSLQPQHVFAEIGSTGLALDPSSAASLKQNRDQYAHAALAFGDSGFDAFFLQGITEAADMQCALMGIRKQSDAPVVASMTLPSKTRAMNSFDLVKTFTMMAEYGADVVGLETGLPLEDVLAKVKNIKSAVNLPILIQLQVNKGNFRQYAATNENPYYCPDTLITAATQLRGAGVQFLRATGEATPAYTGALVAASEGFDVLT